MQGKAFGILAALAVAVAAVILVFDGGDEEAQATSTDGAFLTEMVPHHESAIEMAEVALERAERPQIRRLAEEIIATQSEELDTLESIHERAFGEPVSEGEHGSLGLPAHQMGMEADTEALRKADPFDREFIDMMVAHHQGAIEMARIELAKGADEEAMALAEAVIEAQSAEIEEMNEWRTDWYGAPSPAGGVPPEDDASPPAHEQLGH